LLAISKYITDFVVISIILRFTQKLHLAAAWQVIFDNPIYVS
jgi:hypothetical protein